jgi:hypothetical protein
MTDPFDVEGRDGPDPLETYEGMRYRKRIKERSDIHVLLDMEEAVNDARTDISELHKEARALRHELAELSVAVRPRTPSGIGTLGLLVALLLQTLVLWYLLR